MLSVEKEGLTVVEETLMGPKDRREREKADVKSKILDAAREMFLTYGYEKVTMRMIAEKIEYSPTAIYLHFKDKQALFAELCSRDFQGLAEVFRRIAGIEDPIERLKNIGHAYVSYALEHPNHYRLMFMTPHPEGADEIDRDKKGNPDQDSYAFLKTCVQDCVASRRLRPELTDVDLLCQALWATLHGVVSLHIVMANDKWVEWRPATMTAQLVLEATLRGLLKEPSHG